VHQGEQRQDGSAPPRWPPVVLGATLGLWAAHVLLVYGRIGLTTSVPLPLIWPRVGIVTFASLSLCVPFVMFLHRARGAASAVRAFTIVAIAVAGGLFAGAIVASYAWSKRDTAPVGIAAQFASAAIYWMWIYLGWSLVVVVIINRDSARQRTDHAPTETFRAEVEFWIARNRHRVRVRSQEVFWIEAAGDYVILHTVDREHMLHESLSALTRRLDPREFIRVHRSAIVNLSTIDGVTRNAVGDYLLRLRDGSAVKVGRSYKATVRSVLRLLAKG